MLIRRENVNMNFFDLHCDTLYEMAVNGKDFDSEELHVSLASQDKFSQWIQCFAVWIPDDIRGSKAISLFDSCLKKFEQIKNLAEGTSLKPILTVEGGAVLAGDLSRIKYLKQNDVQIITLTWNGSCELGDGIGVEHPKGLTKFGRECIRALEKNDIVIDVSHASESLFWDVLDIVEEPVVATHSNSKYICGHKRNLSDNQFKAIAKSGGLVGITFCDEFLKEGSGSTFDDVLKHLDHFLSIGGENVLAFGSDFDGADILKCMSGSESVLDLFEFLLKHNYKETLLRKIFHKNAHNFLKLD